MYFNPGLILILDRKRGGRGAKGVIKAPLVTLKLNIFWPSQEENLMKKTRN